MIFTVNCRQLYPILSSEMSVWDGVVVNPLERAYEKPADSQVEEDMEAEEGDMETEQDKDAEEGDMETEQNKDMEAEEGDMGTEQDMGILTEQDKDLGDRLGQGHGNRIGQ